MKHTSSPARRPLRAALLLPALLLLLLPASARAANVTVDCDAAVPPPGVFHTINAALISLVPAGPNVVTVTGTCTEIISIVQFTNLTIQAPAGQMATISPPVAA